METVIAVFHMLVALALIAVILIQDPKGGSIGMFSGGASGSSLLGATGAPSFWAKVTRTLGIFFAVTSIGLTIISRPDTDSVTDRLMPSQIEKLEPQTTPEKGQENLPPQQENSAPTNESSQ